MLLMIQNQTTYFKQNRDMVSGWRTQSFVLERCRSFIRRNISKACWLIYSVLMPGVKVNEYSFPIHAHGRKDPHMVGQSRCTKSNHAITTTNQFHAARDTSGRLTISQTTARAQPRPLQVLTSPPVVSHEDPSFPNARSLSLIRSRKQKLRQPTCMCPAGIFVVRPTSCEPETEPTNQEKGFPRSRECLHLEFMTS